MKCVPREGDGGRTGRREARGAGERLPEKFRVPKAPHQVLAWTRGGRERGSGWFRGPDLEAEAEQCVESGATGWW